MGLLQDTFETTLDGHRIVVEARTFIGKNRFTLLIDGKKADEVRGLAGTHYLRGELPANGASPKPIRVRVVQKALGFGKTQYVLEVDGEERPLGESFIA
jgi:hypothetical protein